MSEQEVSEPLQARADAQYQRLASQPTPEQIDDATCLLKLLWEAREFGRLCELGEWVSHYRPDDPYSASSYAQGRIECGRLKVAVAFFEEAERYCAGPEAMLDELDGLLGRAYKQLFMGSPALGRNLTADSCSGRPPPTAPPVTELP